MIQGIRIRNFQAHEKFTLKFSPQVTTIVGSSDVGKSSILRALYWCCFNKPSGQAFIRDGSDNCRVQVRVDDATIERRRGKSENLYLVNGSEYKSFGTEPPEAISNLLNLDEINFQWQHDSLFWFPLSPGQVAKELNRIVDLSIIDRTVQRISKRLRASEAEVRVCSQLLEDSRDKAKDLEWASECDGDLSKIEKFEAEIDEKGARIDSLASSIQKAGFLLEKSKLLRDATTDGQDLVSRGETAVEKRKRIDSLAQMVGRMKGHLSTIDRCEREVRELKRKIPKTCPLCHQPMSLCSDIQKS